MALNPKLFVAAPPPSPPPIKINLLGLSLPPQPTLSDVMKALDTINSNLDKLAKAIDDLHWRQLEIASINNIWQSAIFDNTKAILSLMPAPA